MVNNPYINVSGLPSFEEQRVTFPSGVFGVPINAELMSCNATFGFNASPHKFDLEYVRDNFLDTRLPQIGSGIAFYVGGEFFISGRVKHADYNKALKGNTIQVSIEDIREDLSDFYVDTFGVFGTLDAPSKNLIDVRYWYLKNYVDTRAYGRSRIIRDLDDLEQQGASYRQIYESIKFYEEQVGTVTDLLNKMPLPEVIESQLPLDPDAYRWKFRGEPLIQVISRIMEDVSFEWYWNMSEQKINVINRKFAINISDTDIPIPEDTSPVINLKYGFDEGERPTNVRLYGAEMEGLVGSGHLMTQSGAYGLSTSQYDLGIEVGKTTFKKGWSAKLKYFGPDGTLQTYIPTDRELAMSLKGIEYWAMEKQMDNRIANSTLNPLTGETTLQRSITGSGIGLIPNRRQLNRVWVIEWYNRVRTFAQNHYGRTYVLSDKTPLYKYIDDIEILSAAWCNIENLTDGNGGFQEDYKISDTYKWLAPFWEPDVNKMRPWALFSSRTKWGIDGESTPASFTEYNENSTFQYVPVEVKKWDSTRKKFEEDFLEELANQEKGILVRLPNIAWHKDATEDAALQTVNRLGSLKRVFRAETTIDLPNPHKVVKVYETLENIAIPIKVKRRYGYAFPVIWASGTGVATEIQIRDDLAPWNYEPRGTKNSVDLMNAEALSAIAGRVVSRNVVTFAEVQRVGLPVISFDAFANQMLGPSGYGIVRHGITNMNLTHSLEWWQTKYSIKSHFPEFIKAKPIKRTTPEDFNFVIKRVTDDIVRRPKLNDFTVPGFSPPVDDGRNSIKSDTGIEHTVERSVVITNVFNRGSNEYYLGIDPQGIKWPRALDANFGTGAMQVAHCVDGFLQIGMQSVYHLEKAPDGSVVHYFTGGIPLEAGRIVEVLSTPRLIQGVWTSSVRTLPTTVTNPQTGQTQVVQPFVFNNVPFLAQQAVDTTISIGDKIMLSGHGNKKGLVPNGDYAPGGARDGDAFLVNTPTPGDTSFAQVTVKPNTNGRGGAIKTIDATGGITYTDGGTVSGSQYNIFFVGVEPDQVMVNDIGVVKKFREAGSAAAFRLVVLLMKPMFVSTDAFGL